MNDLIGKEMYGFKFKSKLHYSMDMNIHIDKIGTIITKDHYDDYGYACRVQFEDGETWSYPYPEVLEHLVENQKEKTTEELVAELQKLISKI